MSLKCDFYLQGAKKDEGNEEDSGKGKGATDENSVEYWQDQRKKLGLKPLRE